MRVPRLYTEQELAPGQPATLPERTAHYLQRVLRLRPGQQLVLFNGDGFDYPGVVLDARCREVEVGERRAAVPESPLNLVLAQGVARGDRMDHSLQKGTELGAVAFQPLFTERTGVRLDGKRLAARMQHWRGVIVAACEQCGRARLPGLAEPLHLDAWLQEATPGPRLVLDPGASESLAGVILPHAAACVVVGPEGGFSETEMAAFARSGARPVRLGRRTLRTETAGPAALAVLQAMHGDLG